MNSAYYVLFLMAAVTVGAVSGGLFVQTHMTAQITCAVPEEPPLPSSLFQKQPIPSQFKSY